MNSLRAFQFVALIICLCGVLFAASTNVIQFGTYTQFELPKLPNGTEQADTITVRCYNTICRDWMQECHWFCDKADRNDRCMECLSWRGQHCYDCFKLLQTLSY
ncbi:hypothetical protein M3Y97_00136500 [Aphelenchoides bicaudatus]|nr:hypothetical protein M3Y97_00136500 [Aphelenchoides bicaudatus]